MARLLSHAFLRRTATPLLRPLKTTGPIPSRFLLGHRNSSSQSAKPELFEIELDPSSMSDNDMESAIKRLEDVVYRVLVRNSTPDWLPFVPGSSFWVPPRQPPQKFVHLVEKLTHEVDVKEEEALSIINPCGWPSSDFFIKGGESDGEDNDVVEMDPPERESKFVVMVLTVPENVAQTENEEG